MKNERSSLFEDFIIKRLKFLYKLDNSKRFRWIFSESIQFQQFLIVNASDKTDSSLKLNENPNEGVKDDKANNDTKKTNNYKEKSQIRVWFVYIFLITFISSVICQIIFLKLKMYNAVIRSHAITLFSGVGFASTFRSEKLVKFLSRLLESK